MEQLSSLLESPAPAVLTTYRDDPDNPHVWDLSKILPD